MKKTIRNSRKKAIWGYMSVNILAFLLLIADIWIFRDLSKQGINLASQAYDMVAKETWRVLLIFTIVTTVWFALGRLCDLFEYKYSYPILGMLGLNTVILLNINHHAFDIFSHAMQKVVNIFAYIVKNPILLIACIIALIVVILKWFLFALIDVVFEIVDMLSWYELSEHLPRLVVYYVLFHLSLLGLSKLNSPLLLIIGISVLVYVMYLLWALNITKYHVAAEEIVIQGHKKSSNIVLRIIKDIATGMVITLLIYCLASLLYSNVLEKWFDTWNIAIVDFNVQEIFYTELSLVFLVISFVTLLANKTETVYWVDVIQYRLVKPNHTSIVDISSYIFANLILSLIAFNFPALSNLVIISFIITIVLLGFLSIKLLISFFGVEHLKEELKREYQKALAYRKLICVLQETCKNPIQLEILRTNNPYEKMELGDFGSRHPMQTNELQAVHDRLLNGEEGHRLRSKKLYKQFVYYAKHFDYKVHQYETMRDGLYSNILKCIDEFRINEIGEQILFLLQYKEYEYAYDCMKKTLQQCPIAFLDMFDESLNEIPKEEDLICFVYQALLDLREDPDNNRLLKSAKYKNAIANFIAWGEQYLDEEQKDKLQE